MIRETPIASTESVSIEDFYELSMESLGLPRLERKLFRRFIEENKNVIANLWSDFLNEEALRPKDDWAPIKDSGYATSEPCQKCVADT